MGSSSSSPPFPFIRGVRSNMAPNFFPALTTILLHFPLSSANSLYSPTTPILQISLLAQSSHLNCGLPLFLQPCSLNLFTLFAILSSPIHTKCPAYLSRYFTNLPVKLICTPISSFSSSILQSRLSIPTILLTQ